MHISTRGQAQLQGDVRLPEFHGAISLTAWKRCTELQDVVAQVRQGQAQGIRMVKDPGVRLIPREGFKTEAIPMARKAVRYTTTVVSCYLVRQLIFPL